MNRASAEKAMAADATAAAAADTVEATADLGAEAAVADTVDLAIKRPYQC
jgi:hypothetical protein